MRHFSFTQQAASIAGVVMTLTMFAPAQTVINMPPPPRKVEKPAPTPAAPAGTTGPAATASTTNGATGYAVQASRSQSVDVGDVALVRYAGVRYGTYDTYSDSGMYEAGIRVYTYPRYFPQFVWGPWWGWGGFGFHNGCR